MYLRLCILSVVFLVTQGEKDNALNLTPSEASKFQTLLKQLSRLGDIKFLGRITGSDPPSHIPAHTGLGSSGDKNESETLVPNIYFEGDIVLRPYQMDQILESAQKDVGVEVGFGGVRRKRANLAKEKNNNRWNPDQILYRMDRNSGIDQKVTREGIQMWEKFTCLKFKEITGKSGDYIEFFKGDGCFSGVGRGGGRQTISIGYGCEGAGIVAHEIGHALGLWHEQSRPDRDGHVRIDAGNLTPGTMGNFLKRLAHEVETSGPFDFGSVMHYGPTSFAIDYSKNTIISKDPNYQNTMGQRDTLSFYDAKITNDIYCQHKCPRKLNCQHNGYTDPKDCSACRCPDGFDGRFCEAAKKTNWNRQCGESDLTATRNWQTISKSGFVDCNWVIKAPAGYKIRIDVSSIRLRFQETCIKEYLEVKYSADMGNTGARLCRGRPSGNLVSETSSAAIVFHGKGGSFRLRYKLEGDDGVIVPPTRPTTTRRPTTTTRRPTTTRATRPPTAFWAAWGAWTRCTQSCGACGVRQRSRRCFGAACGSHPFRYDTQPCQFAACPTRVPDPITTTAKPIGNGLCKKEVRYPCLNDAGFCVAVVWRVCENARAGDGAIEELESPPDADLVQHDASKSLVDGCCAPYRRFGGSCSKEFPIVQTTTQQPNGRDDNWGSWSPWTGCQPGNRQYRGRKCIQGACVGPRYQSKSCNQNNVIDADFVPEILKPYILGQSN